MSGALKCCQCAALFAGLPDMVLIERVSLLMPAAGDTPEFRRLEELSVCAECAPAVRALLRRRVEGHA